MSTRPIIGDFRGTTDNTPRDNNNDERTTAGPTVMPPTPLEDERPVEVKAAVEAAKREAEENARLTPAERYQKRLELLKIDLSTARGIFDAILSKGFYEEYVHLGKNGKRAVLRTRTYEDALRLQTELETQKPYLAVTSDDLVTRYNMAASLYEWDGKPLKHETEEDVHAIIKMLLKLPGPVYTLLARELAKFDQKTMVVFSEGSVENFS